MAYNVVGKVRFGIERLKTSKVGPKANYWFSPLRNVKLVICKVIGCMYEALLVLAVITYVQCHVLFVWGGMIYYCAIFARSGSSVCEAQGWMCKVDGKTWKIYMYYLWSVNSSSSPPTHSVSVHHYYLLSSSSFSPSNMGFHYSKA